jgi:hypothetical protein
MELDLAFRDILEIVISRMREPVNVYIVAFIQKIHYGNESRRGFGSFKPVLGTEIGQYAHDGHGFELLVAQNGVFTFCHDFGIHGCAPSFGNPCVVALKRSLCLLPPPGTVLHEYGAVDDVAIGSRSHKIFEYFVYFTTVEFHNKKVGVIDFVTALFFGDLFTVGYQ